MKNMPCDWDILKEIRSRPAQNIEPRLVARAVFLFARGARDGFNPEFEPSMSEWLECLSNQNPAHIRTAVGESGLTRLRQLFFKVNKDLPPAVGLIADIDRCQLTLAGVDSLGAKPRCWPLSWQTLAFVIVPLRAAELQDARGFLAGFVAAHPYTEEIDGLAAAFPSISKTRGALRCWLGAVERAAVAAAVEKAAENNTP